MLTENGLRIYKELEAHCTETMGMQDIDHYALELLADSIDKYNRCAEILEREGLTQIAKTGFAAARPELAIQKDCADKILRLSAMFGITPGSRRKVFLMKPKDKKKVSITDGLDD
ncbi:MAG: phage terminase small subunit P27 family [Cyclobacteriaceae bacterium]|nr:phage terminase small subunit P27 family [Cyclobacteriaceae bacterium]